MNAINNALHGKNVAERDRVSVSHPLDGADLTIGSGFEAQSFRSRDVGEVMDPLVMVDHYVMTESTFGAHPHAGFSAVTLLFEDSKGLFHNRDSLGNDFDLQPGDLYWLKAGRGAVHDESPRKDARTHGLQVFVNMPESRRFEAPASLLVRTQEMPLIKTAGYSVKIALGESNGISGVASPALPMTILDGTIQPGGRFSHESASARGVWVQVVEGSLQVMVGEQLRHLTMGQAVAINTNSITKVSISNSDDGPAHFAMFDGERISETYVQDGPFVMGSKEQIADIKAAYEAGQLGSITDNR